MDARDARQHKQVQIEGFGQKAEVDEGLAEVISELWRLGVKTRMSCQGDQVYHNRRGKAWIQAFQGSYEHLGTICGQRFEPDDRYTAHFMDFGPELIPVMVAELRGRLA